MTGQFNDGLSACNFDDLIEHPRKLSGSLAGEHLKCYQLDFDFENEGSLCKRADIEYKACVRIYRISGTRVKINRSSRF